MTTALRVLLVDDNARFRGALQEYVESFSQLRVAGTAGSGEEAIIEAGRLAPGLVLMDLDMPGIGGLEATRALKRLPNPPKVAVVTLHGQQDYRREALEAGADFFIAKDRLDEEFPAAVRQLTGVEAIQPGPTTAPRVDDAEARASLEQFAHAIDATADAIYLVDRASMSFLYVNESACRMRGRSREELMVLGPADLLGMPRAELERTYDAIIEGGCAEPEELRITRPDGTQIWAEVRRRAHRSPEGWTIVAVVRDITERKQAEEVLRASEARLRAILENEPECVKVLDAEGRVIEMNPAGVRMVEAETPEQIIGQCAYGLVAPEYRAAFRALTERACRGEGGGELEFEIVGLKGGRRWLETHATSLADGATGRMAALGLTRDITERKRAEAELRESEERFRKTFELAASGMAHVGLDGRYLRVNRKLCEMFGYAEADLVGRLVKNLSYPEDRDVADPQLARMRAGEIESAKFDKRYLRKDGAAVWTTVTVALQRDPVGTTQHEIVVIEDISAHKQSEAKIAGLNRVHAVLSGINSLIVRVRDRDTLLQEGCRVAVEAGGFRAAWIGVVQGDRIAPVASRGLDEEYLRAMPVQRNPGADGAGTASKGLAVLAIEERRPIVADDLTTDPRIVMRLEARERGLRSLAILPLVVSGEAAGVLALYAGEAGFFNSEEMKLLEELAADISFALEHLQNTEKLDRLAFYDQVTGLANRTLFLDRLSQSIHAAAQSQAKFALAVLDLERMRTINESLGRQAGDALLDLVARRLENAAGTGAIARVGADQFAVVLADVKGRSEAARRVQTLQQRCFAEAFKVAGTELRIAARVGIALYPNDGPVAETLLNRAETALRKGKQSGERHAFYTPDLSERTVATLTFESKLRQALEKEEFVLHYQPKVELETRRIVGMEALIRWQSPELGLVPPAKFIPLMEETGLILEAGAWALRRAALDHRRWTELKLNPPRVAVNVSEIQLRQRDFVHSVEQAILEGVAPAGIDLEITESQLMGDIEGSIQKLKEARALGVRIALDDFGTGYSSLAYLARLPVHELKIDRSFIITMLQEPDTMSLVQTMISLAHSLKLTVVAEGVDAEDQARLLRLLRCDQMQGYLISKPVPFEAMAGLLQIKDS